MNYEKLYYRLSDGLDLKECNIRRLKLMRTVKEKANMHPMNLAQKIEHRSKLGLVT
tara:strand:+ start:615 stop:782 length:168 start_codon:yes stop_codon:yes gene_type:complete